jgi:hypothetical protein
MLTYRTLFARALEFHEALADQESFAEGALDTELLNFITLSARVDLNGTKLDFELAELKDSPEEIEGKFLQYLDGASYELVQKMLEKIDKMDEPLDEALAPEAPDSKK